MKNTKRSTFSTSDLIETIKYPILLAPFFGARIPIELRVLTQAQTYACGNFSLIETFQDKIYRTKSKPKLSDIVQYAEVQHEIVKATLVKPTYQQIFDLIGSDFKTDEKRKELTAMKELMKKTPRGPERTAIEEEIDACRIWVDLILPEDFITFVVAYTLGIDRSDIKKISEEILINAALLAERGHDNPCDHLEGNFSAFMRDDVNRRSWLLLQEKRENKNAS